MIGGFFVLNPRIAYAFPWHYTRSSRQFIDSIRRNNTLDVKQFWQFREFYSLGSFSFDPQIVSFGESLIIQAMPNKTNELLHFSSDRLQSSDMVIKVPENEDINQTLTAAINEKAKNINVQQILFKDEHTVLFEESENTFVLFFTRPIEEMEKVNGFFNFSGNEKKLLEHSIWVSETRFW